MLVYTVEIWTFFHWIHWIFLRRKAKHHKNFTFTCKYYTLITDFELHNFTPKFWLVYVEPNRAQVIYNMKLGCDWWPLPLYFTLTCRLTAAEIRFLRSTKDKNSNRDEDNIDDDDDDDDDAEEEEKVDEEKKKVSVLATGMTPGGSSTLHIYKQTIHRTTQITK